MYASKDSIHIFQQDVRNIYESLIKLNTTGLNMQLYSIDYNSAYLMNVCFYKLLTQDNTTHIAYSLSVIYSYIGYLQHYMFESGLESLLLFKPPGKNDKSALVVKLLLTVRSSNFASSTSCEVDFSRLFNVWVSRFPTVAALLDEPLRELPPDRDDKVRVCAYPGCNIDGKGLFSKMLKCGRCRKTYYCNVLHQRGHWKVHKQTCISVTTTTDTATPTTTEIRRS